MRSRIIIVRTIGGKFFMPRGLNLFGYLDGKPNITPLPIYSNIADFSVVKLRPHTIYRMWPFN